MKRERGQSSREPVPGLYTPPNIHTNWDRLISGGRVKKAEGAGSPMSKEVTIWFKQDLSHRQSTAAVKCFKIMHGIHSALLQYSEVHGCWVLDITVIHLVVFQGICHDGNSACRNRLCYEAKVRGTTEWHLMLIMKTCWGRLYISYGCVSVKASGYQVALVYNRSGPFCTSWQ